MVRLCSSLSYLRFTGLTPAWNSGVTDAVVVGVATHTDR
jgi:hypothetical protein